MGLMIGLFLLGMAFGVCLLPGIFLLANLRDEAGDNARAFEDAFTPIDRG